MNHRKKKVLQIILKKIENLHFIPNNILTKFFKKLKKIKK